jgi:hypothetical protein
MKLNLIIDPVGSLALRITLSFDRPLLLSIQLPVCPFICCRCRPPALLKRTLSLAHGLGLVNLNNTKWALNRTENEAAYGGAYCSPLSALTIITRRERK